MAFTLRKDTGNIPVAGYQDSPDAIDILLWAPLKITDETDTTDVNGDFTADNKPFLDVSRDQDRIINGYDITAKKTADSAPLYIKADGTGTWPKDGKVRLYTNPECTTVFANSSAKVTYWTLIAVKVNSSGQFEIVNTNLGNLDVNLGAKTDAESASGDASVIAILKNLRTRLGNLETYTDGLEGSLTAIKDTDGVKKITDTVVIKADAGASQTNDLKVTLDSEQVKLAENTTQVVGKVVVRNTVDGGGEDNSIRMRDSVGGNTTSIINLNADDKAPGNYPLGVASLPTGYVGDGKWDRIRATKIFKYVDASSAGDNAVWTPAAGKKFRLLGFILACGGTGVAVYFKDGATQISPTFTLAANQITQMDLGNGYLSSTANNVLNANLGAANTVGIWAYGTEE
jgi:hypothetical protein